MKQIQLKDFLNYRFLSNVKMSGDKKKSVFGVSVCDEENNTYKHNLYVIKEGQCLSLTSSDKEGDFLFLDDDTILLQSNRSEADQKKIKEGEELTTYYTLSLNGGEAVRRFSLPISVGSIKKVKTGVYVILANYDLDYSIWGREDQKEELLKKKKADSDYEFFEKIPFYNNGSGFSGKGVSRLFLYDERKDHLEAITNTNMDVESFNLSEEDEKIIFTAVKTANKASFKEGIFTYDIKTKKLDVVLEEKEYSVSDAYFFGDKILFTGNKEYTYGMNENERFFVIDKNSDISLLFDNQMGLWNSVGSDCRLKGGTVRKLVDNKLYYLSTIEKDCVLMSIDSKGKVQEEIHINGSVDSFDIFDDQITFIAMKDGALQEVYQYVNGSISELTKLNDCLVDKYVAKYERVPFENDGIEFMGWVLLPKDYDPQKKYPAILDIHGGPKTVYGEVFYHEMQLWANLGYIVFFTNPRGSDGRDNNFMDIFGKYGTIDYADLMKFTDTVIKTYPAVDTDRIGVTGGSYGGFMTNWIITHTNRFKCAATQRSISNWVSFYGTSDIGYFFTEDQVRGNIYDSMDKLWEQSPLKYASHIVTPTLFIHSDEDYRCPLEQGLQLYTSMVDRNIEARFALFHGENHELSRSGKPQHRVRRLSEITNWMEKHLK